MRDALSLHLPLHPNEHVYPTRACAVYFLSDYHFSLTWGRISSQLESGGMVTLSFWLDSRPSFVCMLSDQSCIPRCGSVSCNGLVTSPGCNAASRWLRRLAVKRNGWMDSRTAPEVQSFLKTDITTGEGLAVITWHYRRCSLKETITIQKEMGGKKEGKWQHWPTEQKYLPITRVTEWRLQARWVPVIPHWCHCVAIDYLKPLRVQGWPGGHSVQMAGRWSWSIPWASRRETLWLGVFFFVVFVLFLSLVQLHPFHHQERLDVCKSCN